MSGYRGNVIFAIDLNKATGDITESDAILWKYSKKTTSYTPSALLANNNLYFLNSNKGELTCLNVTDTTENYVKEKLEDMGIAYASPVGVGDRIYIPGGNGHTYVIKQIDKFEIIAKNSLDDGFYASPVVVGNDLFLRGFKYLYCISED